MNNIYSIAENDCPKEIIDNILKTFNSVREKAEGQSYISFLLNQNKFIDINAFFSTFELIIEVIGVSPTNKNYVLIQVIEEQKLKKEIEDKIKFLTNDIPLNKNTFLNLTEKYIGSIFPNKKILIYYYKEFTLEKELNKNTETFKIHINSGRQSQTINCDEKSLFGVDWSVNDLKLPEANKSKSKFIIESPEGIVLGEGYNNDLFLFIKSRNTDLYKFLLQYVNNFYSLSEKEFKEKVKKDKEVFILKQKETFANFCLLGIKGAIRRTQTKLQDLNRDRNEFSKQLLRKVKEIIESEFKISSLEEKPKKQKEKYIHQFDEIIKLVQVKKIVTENNRIKIILERLYLTNPETKKLHDLGDIVIIIKPDEVDVNSAIRFKNTSLNIANRAAPHIYPEGWACFGSAEVAVHEALGKQDYTNLILVLISFLESLNMSDPFGKDIIKWPLVKEKKDDKQGS